MYTVVWALLLLFCADLNGYDATADVDHADKSYRRARNARDVLVLQRLLTDDFSFIRRTGDIWDRKAFLENVRAGALASNVQQEDLKARIYGDSAILTSKDSFKTSNGSTVEMIATRVFVKQSGAWKLASVQDTQLPTR